MVARRTSSISACHRLRPVALLGAVLLRGDQDVAVQGQAPPGELLQPGTDGRRQVGAIQRQPKDCTAVSTLLTFWPPGPEARMNVSSMARSSIASVLVTWIIAIGRMLS